MHGFGHAAGYGTEFAGSGLSGAPREEIVNNYYGVGSPNEHHEVASSIPDRADRLGDISEHYGDSSRLDTVSDKNDGGSSYEASNGTDGSNQFADTQTNADEISATTDTDYSSQGDDSMLSDDVGDQGFDSDGGFDSGGGDFGGYSGSF
jgi:hypothetical protein